ncbi:Co2+/Mg2+ efflux protein ApaG [Christiangramia sp. SM2212]|uniref:Co2+/Mg2+ efflux protein ApaG n=1 Tax=Christiangramia sediminicola TaxID=3073267 RepID=A0ABU1EN20_9FLAO|nr:Co2+/Mg2+ efflux protein ApaG [Christiangramia sp. SM2212]MDR5589568.1 Co2+/Mg2+ efflux protein ApaG [Christiangramia sp. SM2212]
MIHQITRGIKISVETHFEGMFYKDYRMQHAFGYQITIENQSNDSVQLESRFWVIKDSLNETETVSGDGVIGKQPVLQPGERHTYKSGCLLRGPIGSMNGHYNMRNFSTGKNFTVKIPSFKLGATYALN